MKKALFAFAKDTYRHVDNRQRKAYIVMVASDKAELLSCVMYEIFKRIVMKIQLGDGIVRLILKNNQVVDKKNDQVVCNDTIDRMLGIKFYPLLWCIVYFCGRLSAQ